MRIKNALIIALLASISLFGASKFWSAQQGPDTSTRLTMPSLVDRIESGTISAGYGVYPPYTQEDPNTRKVTGFSVDIVEEIARQLNVKVIWHRINWNTMGPDLKRGTFDLIADPIFLTIPRAIDFQFTEPYVRFADGIGVVRSDEKRISSFDDLATAGLRIVVGQGFSAEAVVKARFPNANIRSIQVNNDLLQLYNEVIAGRADIAINDAADAERFAKEHAAKVKVLWLDSPPLYTPAGFVVRKDDIRGARFLNVALRNLEATGVLQALAQRHQIRTLAPIGR